MILRSQHGVEREFTTNNSQISFSPKNGRRWEEERERVLWIEMAKSRLSYHINQWVFWKIVHIFKPRDCNGCMRRPLFHFRSPSACDWCQTAFNKELQVAFVDWDRAHQTIFSITKCHDTRGVSKNPNRCNFTLNGFSFPIIRCLVCMTFRASI